MWGGEGRGRARRRRAEKKWDWECAKDIEPNSILHDNLFTCSYAVLFPFYRTSCSLKTVITIMTRLRKLHRGLMTGFIFIYNVDCKLFNSVL